MESRFLVAMMFVRRRMSGESPKRRGRDLSSGYVVIVGRSPEQAQPLSDALVGEGWEVEICEGPDRIRCPLCAGEDCSLRDSASAVVAYVDVRKEPRLSLPLVRCASSSFSPSVVILEGEVDEPHVEGGFATVGSLRPPTVVAHVLEEVFGAASHLSPPG